MSSVCLAEVRDDLDSQAAHELDQVNRALTRLDASEYGECVECGERTGDARLSALPYTNLCIRCAEEAEQDS